MQLEVEKAHYNNSELHGFALDIQKCYNGIPRAQVLELFRKVGFPQWAMKAWANFLEIVSRSVIIKQSCSEPELSYTGIPEGDPLSVPAMISVCILWHFYVLQDQPHGSLKTWAYLDNLELTATHLLDLLSGIRRSWDFLAAFALKPDIKKSWSWSTKKLSDEDKISLLETSDHLGTLKHEPRAGDLGASLCYRGGKRVKNIRVKFAEAAERISRMNGLPITLAQQWRVIQASCSAKVLYALEVLPLGLQHFQTLRKKIANLIIQQQNRNEYLANAFSHYPVVDPEVTCIKNCFRLARRFLLQFPEMASSFGTWLSGAPETCAKIKGPIGCLKRWILRLG